MQVEPTSLAASFKRRKTMPAKKSVVDIIMNKDRISELPKNLIESILEKLSIKEAARTSILSTKWRYIWTKIPKLVLDRRFFTGLTPNKRTKSSQFVRIVNNILMLHNGPIQKFKIYIPFSQTPDMDLWILYLSRNGVKELILHNSNSQSYKLPSYIFSCDQLTNLSLSNCVLNTPLQFSGFCHLTDLFLKKISLSTNAGSLISTLPSLVTLTLWLCTGVENINNLPPTLVEFLLVDSHTIEGQIFKLNYFLSNLRNLSLLALDGFALTYFAAGDFTEFHQLGHKLKDIILHSLQFNDLDQVSCTLRLLKSFPNLEELQIKASVHLNDALEQHDFSYIFGVAYSNLKLNRLRSVKLGFFTGLNAELALVKLILSCSPVLKKVEIQSKGGMDADELEISMQLMRFRRASAESEIIYTRGQIN